MSPSLRTSSIFDQLVSHAQDHVEERRIGEAWLAWMQTLEFPELIGRYLELRSELKKSGWDRVVSVLDDYESQLDLSTLARPEPLTAHQREEQSARDVVLSLQFPDVKPYTDEDIAKYFAARSKSDLDAARVVYQRLIAKYPIAEERSNLLRWHRTGRALYALHYFQLRNALADRAIDQIKKTIFYFLSCFSASGGQKAWDVLTRIKTAAKALPADRKQASVVLQQLLTFSQALRFHAQEFGSISEVLADYLGDNLFLKKEIVLVLPQNLDDSKVQEKPKALVQTYEFDKVTFSASDLKEILINPKIQGTENVTLTYCYQYWLKAFDSEFEGKITLYSMKHKSNHHSIFQIVKNGRQAGIKDEDILYSVYNLIVKDNSYDYNVRKDVYMQNVWRRIKPGQVEKVYAEDTYALAEERIRQAKELKARRKQKAEQAIVRQRQEKVDARTRAAQSVSNQKRLSAQSRQRAEERVAELRKAEKKRLAEASERARAERLAQKPSRQVPPTVATSANEWTRYDGSEQEVVSIRDRVQQLERGNEKNLHHVFRSRLEGEIQTFVQEFVQSEELEVKHVQMTLTVLAIKDFLLNHYDKTNRSWILSNERMKVKELGLNVSDVEPIIERCLANLTREVAVVS